MSIESIKNIKEHPLEEEEEVLVFQSLNQINEDVLLPEMYLDGCLNLPSFLKEDNCEIYLSNDLSA